MAICMRRGSYADLDTSKLKAGEWAIVLSQAPHCQDGRSVYICFSPGNVKEMATYEDMVEQFGSMTDDIIKQLTEDINAVIIVANDAIENANAVAEDLILRRDAGEFDGPPGKDGVAVITQLSPGLFAIAVDSRGHLIVTHNDNEPVPPLEVREGHLVYTVKE